MLGNKRKLDKITLTKECREVLEFFQRHFPVQHCVINCAIYEIVMTKNENHDTKFRRKCRYQKIAEYVSNMLALKSWKHSLTIHEEQKIIAELEKDLTQNATLSKFSANYCSFENGILDKTKGKMVFYMFEKQAVYPLNIYPIEDFPANTYTTNYFCYSLPISNIVGFEGKKLRSNMRPEDYTKLFGNEAETKSTAQLFTYILPLKTALPRQELKQEQSYTLKEIVIVLDQRLSRINIATCLKSPQLARKSINKWVQCANDFMNMGPSIDMDPFNYLAQLTTYVENNCNESLQRAYELLTLTAILPQPAVQLNLFAESYKNKFTIWGDQQMQLVPGACFSAFTFAKWILFEIGVQETTEIELQWLLTIIARAFGFPICILLATLAQLQKKPLFNCISDDTIYEAIANAAFLENLWPRGTNPSNSLFIHTLQRALLAPY